MAKILFLTSRHPFPPVGGDKLRAAKMIQHLGQKHSLTVVSLVGPYEEARTDGAPEDGSYRMEFVPHPRWRSYLSCMQGIFSQIPLQAHYFHSPRMAKEIRRLLWGGGYDLIFVHLLRMAQYVKSMTGIPRILDLTDSYARSYERAKESLRDSFSALGALYALDRLRVRRYEDEAMWKYERIIVVTEAERRYLRDRIGSEKIRVVGMGVDRDNCDSPRKGRAAEEICFVGNMRTLPNSDAVCYFAGRVLPLIERKLGRVRFTIVGADPPLRVRRLADGERIVVTGMVPDTRPYLLRASVSVCPMRLGAGLQTKVLEALAMGTPVVTTSRSLEGIDAVAGEHLLVADGAQDFADAVVSLLTNPALRRSLAEAGRELVERKYSWEKQLTALDAVVAEVTEPRG